MNEAYNLTNIARVDGNKNTATPRIGLINVGDPLLNIDDKNNIDGLLYDVWKQIEKNKKLTPELSLVKDADYDEEIMKLKNNEYDALIGDFTVNAERSNLVNFTRSIFLDKKVILYQPKQSSYVSFSLINRLFAKWVLPFLILIAIGFILGYVFYRIDPRKKNLTALTWATLIALLGEPGTLVDRDSVYSIPSLTVGLLILIILLVSFYYNIYLETATIADTLNYIKFFDPISVLKGKKILTYNNSQTIELLKQNQAIPIIPENIEGIDGLAKIYTDNTDKYDGYIQSETLADTYLDNYPTLKKSKYKLGYDEISFVVSKDNQDLLNIINNALIELHDKGFVEKKCSLYLNRSCTG